MTLAGLSCTLVQETNTMERLKIDIMAASLSVFLGFGGFIGSVLGVLDILGAPR